MVATGVRPLDEFRFYRILSETPGTSLVFFTAPGCGACRVLRHALAQLCRLEPALQLFEVDAGHSLALAREYEVHHLPAMFLFQDGQYHCPLHSYPEPAQLQRAIALALSQPAQDAP